MSSEQRPEQGKPEESTKKAKDELSEGKGSRFAWWKNLSTPLKALLSLAGGFILAGILAVILTTGGNENILPPEDPPAPAPAEPDPDQLLPEGGSADRVTGIRISPFSQTIQGNKGGRIDPIVVQNGSAQEVKVIVNYIPAAGNTLDGSPVYGISKKTINQGKKEVRPNTNSFQLDPGAQRSVGATIVGEPKQGRQGIFGVMAFSIDDGTTSELDEAVGAGVNIRVKRLYRVAALVNIQFPGNINDSFEIRRIRATENEQGIQFLARVRNTGNFITRVGGELTITGSEGVVARIPIAQQGSLPENERDLTATEAVQGLSPGRYRADVTLDSGNSQADASWEFRIDENGNLPSPAAEFALRADPSIVEKNQPYNVTAQLRNDGTKSFSTRGNISLVEVGDTEVLEKRTITIGNIDPGESGDAQVDFPGIPSSGNYELIMQAEADDGTSLGQRVASVLVREAVDKPTLSEKIRDWMSANPLGTMIVGIGIVGLLLALGLGIYLLLQRRKK
jgi:hypothetical protein